MRLRLALSIATAAGVAQRRALGLALGASLALAGCGGSAYVSYSWGDDDNTDSSPRVELVASVDEAAPGEAVRLVAAAVDDRGQVERVTFYRDDAGRAVELGSDRSEPFELTVTVPADGRGSLDVWARAVDGQGHYGQSAAVTITIR